jgi:hypothetical protein
MFDAINHLTSPRDVQRCFQRVYDALLPGGYFVFDVNNELCFRTVWRQTEAIHGDDYTIILQNSFAMRKRLAKSHVTLFVKKGNYFERKTETIRERYYPRQEIDSALRRVGFCMLECEDFNFTPNPLVGEIKTWWVVRRES